MGRFVVDEVKVIRASWWDDGEEVTIRRFSYGDRTRISTASNRMERERDADGQLTGKMLVTLDLEALNLTMLLRGIASWTLKGPDGKALPVTREWIERLRNEDGEFILAEIEAFNEREVPEVGAE